MLHLVRGLPGSGKTTFARSKLFAGMLIIEQDQFWVTAEGEYKFDASRAKEARNYLLNMITAAMLLHVNCVVTGLFLTNKSIEPIIALCRQHHCNITFWRCVNEFDRPHGENDATMDAMRQKFEDLTFPENIVSTLDTPYQIISKTPGTQANVQTNKEEKENEHKEA